MYVASTFRRIIAHLTDEVIGSVFWIPLMVSVWSQMNQTGDIVLPWPLLLTVWVARMCYEIICIYMLQALPAQHFLGLKIISTYHPELGLSLFQSVLRVLFAQLNYLLGPSIYFMALFHRERQHLGDILAETRVVQSTERVFSPKARVVLGSILVYVSLVNNLNEAIDLVSAQRIGLEGIKIELPEFKIQIDGI